MIFHTIIYSQFKEGIGETLEGVFWQLPNPVPRQIPKEDEREKGKIKPPGSFYSTFTFFSFNSKHGQCKHA